MKSMLSVVPMPLACYYTPDACRKIHKLAGALCVALNIPDGDHLVMLLGHGGEPSNLEAVKTWVTETLIEGNLLPTRQAIPVLLNMLEHELTVWQDTSW